MSIRLHKNALQKRKKMIRVNTVSPGPVDTPLERSAYHADNLHAYEEKASIGVPMQRIAIPEEIAPSILFLADYDSGSYITGSNLTVDGGNNGCPLFNRIQNPNFNI